MPLLTFSSFAALEVRYSLGEISRGDIERTIADTGNIGPVMQGEVGTQVSGVVDGVVVAFNDRVDMGEITGV